MNIPKVLPRNLRFEDIGMMAWLLTNTAKGEYITEATIIAASPAGRDHVRTILLRLTNAGLLTRERARVQGRVAGVKYTVSSKFSA